MESQEWCLEYPRRVLEGPSSGLKGQGRGLGSGISLQYMACRGIWKAKVEIRRAEEGSGRRREGSGGPMRGLDSAGGI